LPFAIALRKDHVVLIIALLLAGGMWLYVQWVMLPFERARFAAAGRPQDPGDLYPRWYGTRELLLHGRDPYGPEVSGEIQVAYYGHPLDTAGADRGRDEQRFAYPLYVVFLLAPTIEMPFPVVRIVVRWVLAFATAATVLLWLRALQWRPPVAVVFAIIVLTLSSPPLVQALKLQQLGLLVGFFLVLSTVLVSDGYLAWAGFFLALATIKPQLALLPVVWFLIWVVGDWKNRQRLFWGFGGTIAVLAGAAQALLPGWIGRFAQGLIAYRKYALMSSLLDHYLPPQIVKPVTALALCGLLFFCVRWHRDSAGVPSFLVRFALILSVAVIVLPPLWPPFNQALLLPGVLVVLCSWKDLWNRGSWIRTLCWLGAGLVLWSWLTAAIFAVSRIVAPASRLFDIWAFPPVTFSNVWAFQFVMSYGLPPFVAALLMVLLRSEVSKSEVSKMDGRKRPSARVS
jgi:Glycosyltransferase family 87